MLTGAPIDAHRLQALGVVNRVVADGTALAEALALGHTLARGPRRVQADIKALLDSAPTAALDDQLALERDCFIENLFGADAGEGVEAFRQRRAPQFNRSPA